MQMAQGEGIAGDINVTPMIDVLLVLIIIAMILLQLRAVFDVNVPVPKGPSTPGRPGQIVLDLPAAGGYRINGSGVSEPALEARIHAIYARRIQKILLVHAAGERPYHDVIHAIDVARSAGVQIIGYMP
ncbi:MAG TPA: biopolymer transporter ExbD [Gemmatimonadales bacterium]|nr:biopolymer transporter ExbD [Gemmatimonadales bacterium]